MGENINKRLLWLDVVKLISTFLIVLQHTMSQEWVRYATERGTTFFILNVVYMLSKIGVPLFFMCSGVGMLQKRRSIKSVLFNNVKKLLIPYCCWMLVYGVMEATKASSFRIGINIMLKSLLFGHYHTWFLLTLFGLYILVPIFQEFVDDKELLQYFLLLSVVFTIFLPYIEKVKSLERVQQVVNNINMHMVMGYSLYFLLGYYLKLIQNKKWTKYLAIGLFIGTWIAGAVISYFASATKGQDCQIIYADFSIWGFLLASSFFILVKALVGEERETNNKVISTIVSLGIGIYLMHPLLLPLVNGLVGFERLIAAIIVYSIALATCYIIYLLPIRRWFLS